MTIRAKVAVAIMEADHGRKGKAAIKAFLEAAAEAGWHMCRDEATEEMAHKANKFNYHSEYTRGQDLALRIKYRAMLAAADKFEVGQ